MNKKYHTGSRKRTPWDDYKNPSNLQTFIRDEYLTHYEQRHNSLLREAELLNSFKPKKCPHCGSTEFKLNGKTKNKTQKYKCKKCDKNFTVITNTIFDNHKNSFGEWIEFILNLLSNSSINSIAKNNKNAHSTSKFWIKKLFILLEDYQSDIMLKGNVYIDEMFYTVVQSELERKDNKLYRGLSKNKFCIGIACDDNHVICFVEGKAKTSSQKTLNAFKNHIEPGSVLIHDGEKAHNTLIKERGLKEEFYK